MQPPGVELALWEPFDDHVLRFQANRALAESGIVRGGRAQLRAPASWPVPVWAGRRRKSAHLYSLSAAGAYLSTWRPSLPDARVRVGIPLPSGPIRLHARVMMTNVPGNLIMDRLPVGMGVRFEETPPEIQATLVAWANDRLDALGF